MLNDLDKKICSGDDYIDLLSTLHARTSPLAVSFVNPFSYYLIGGRSQLLAELDYVFSDGLLLCLMHRIFCGTKISRASFDYSSIAELSFRAFNEQGLSVALIGATEAEIRLAATQIADRFPGLNVSLVEDGYMASDDKMMEVLKLINRRLVDVVVVGMGAPKQEEFIVQVKQVCPNVKLAVTCGGFFTQTAMRGDYYHPLVKRTGLRWLQRAVMHKHVRKRLLREYPAFTVKYVMDHLLR